MIKTSNLRYTYQEGPTFDFPDIAVDGKEHLLVLGPSGVGKTTFLHLLAGILPPTQGTISINDVEITALDRKDLDGFRGANIGLIFQQYHYIQSLTVEENLKVRMRSSNKSFDKERLLGIAERLGIADQLHKKVNQLSQGQQQRLSIALGLIHQPKVVFADEPTSNLDDANCDEVLKLLKEEATVSDSILVIITHDQRVKEHFSNQLVL